MMLTYSGYTAVNGVVNRFNDKTHNRFSEPIVLDREFRNKELKFRRSIKVATLIKLEFKK